MHVNLSSLPNKLFKVDKLRAMELTNFILHTHQALEAPRAQTSTCTGAYAIKVPLLRTLPWPFAPLFRSHKDKVESLSIHSTYFCFKPAERALAACHYLTESTKHPMGERKLPAQTTKANPYLKQMV